jgi:hypothetical protein
MPCTSGRARAPRWGVCQAKPEGAWAATECKASPFCAPDKYTHTCTVCTPQHVKKRKFKKWARRRRRAVGEVNMPHERLALDAVSTRQRAQQAQHIAQHAQREMPHALVGPAQQGAGGAL